MSGKFAYLHECLFVCLYLTLADMFLFGFLEKTGELNSAGLSKSNIGRLPFHYHRFQMATTCHCHIVLDSYVFNNYILITIGI